MEVNINDEYTRLVSVILAIPDFKYWDRLRLDPHKCMWPGGVPNWWKLRDEVFEYIDLLESNGVRVWTFTYKHYPNEIFVRDAAFVINDMVIFAKMRHSIRWKEPIDLSTKFYFKYTMKSPCVMEGADPIVTPRGVVVGVGRRTEMAFCDWIGGLPVIKSDGTVPQHLLGFKHPISKDTLVYREGLGKDTLGYKNTIPLAETDEVVKGYAMNFVVLDENEVIMPDDCPKTKAILENHGVIVHQTKVVELRKMGGAWACATLPVYREGKANE